MGEEIKMVAYSSTTEYKNRKNKERKEEIAKMLKENLSAVNKDKESIFATDTIITDFYDCLLFEYDKLNKSKILKPIFIPIYELRRSVCNIMKISKQKFNSLFTKLINIDSTNNIPQISLHGAPTNMCSRVPSFEYNKKRYIYVTVKFK